jgi:hypothetical protein
MPDEPRFLRATKEYLKLIVVMAGILAFTGVN